MNHKYRKSHARCFGRISQSRGIPKVQDFRNPNAVQWIMILEFSTLIVRLANFIWFRLPEICQSYQIHKCSEKTTSFSIEQRLRSWWCISHYPQSSLQEEQVPRAWTDGGGTAHLWARGHQTPFPLSPQSGRRKKSQKDPKKNSE